MAGRFQDKTKKRPSDNILEQNEDKLKKEHWGHIDYDPRTQNTDAGL